MGEGRGGGALRLSSASVPYVCITDRSQTRMIHAHKVAAGTVAIDRGGEAEVAARVVYVVQGLVTAAIRHTANGRDRPDDLLYMGLYVSSCHQGSGWESLLAFPIDGLRLIPEIRAGGRWWGRGGGKLWW